jgi:hypothetical protein
MINKIPVNSNDRSLIIYDKNNKSLNFNNNEKFFNSNKYKNWLLTHAPVYKIYYGKIYNPPFFNNIITFKENNLEDVQKIWNMTILNGFFVIEDSFEKYFEKYIFYKDVSFQKIIVQKNINITYNFPKYRIIDSIIAGTMKGGTSAGIYNLTKHPDISTVKKEIGYFEDMKNYQKGIEWYKSHFDYTKKITVDKNHDVMYQSSCLKLLQEINPQVKIILFLRNPIERAYSHWKMMRDKFNCKDSFEYCVMDEIKNRWNENRITEITFRHHFVQRGFYYEQIEEILKYFPKDNLFIAISEKIKDNMDKEYQKVFSFLNLPECHADFEEIFTSNTNNNVNKNSKLYKFLKDLYTKDVRNLEKFIGYKTDWW